MWLKGELGKNKWNLENLDQEKSAQQEKFQMLHRLSLMLGQSKAHAGVYQKPNFNEIKSSINSKKIPLQEKLIGVPACPWWLAKSKKTTSDWFWNIFSPFLGAITSLAEILKCSLENLCQATAVDPITKTSPLSPFPRHLLPLRLKWNPAVPKWKYRFKHRQVLHLPAVLPTFTLSSVITPSSLRSTPPPSSSSSPSQLPLVGLVNPASLRSCSMLRWS